MKFSRAVMAALAGGLVATATLPAEAALSQLTAEWYTINWGHADTEHSIDGTTTGLVQRPGLKTRSQET